jgi:hypothetical protein
MAEAGQFYFFTNPRTSEALQTEIWNVTLEIAEGELGYVWV